MSDQYIQAPLFYTEEEVEAKVNETIASRNLYTYDEVQERTNIVRGRTTEEIQQITLNVMRSTDLVDRETAIALYNEIANACGWDEATVLTQYEVEVIYDDTTIGTFTVEAEDEDSAMDIVRDNMEAEATMTVSVSFNDEACEGEIYVSQWDLNDFTFNAQEA
jgi:hypothetical protein